MAKNLIAFFSATDSTRNVANILAEITGDDIYEIKPADPYTVEDLDTNRFTSRTSVEKNDLNARPKIADKNANIDEYDKIYLGFPIWWYVPPRIINTFLESYDFTDKTIILFATSRAAGLGQSAGLLHTSAPNAKFIEGKVFRGRANRNILENWIKSLNV